MPDIPGDTNSIFSMDFAGWHYIQLQPFAFSNFPPLFSCPAVSLPKFVCLVKS